ncbi:MAG: sigma-70 family RNA polymerase sigma factor [Spirochaetota bacterium]
MKDQIQDRDNDQWLAALSSPGLLRDGALSDLRIILLRGLKAALRGWIRTSGHEFGELCEDFVHEALMQILDKKDTFKGLSRFTTWAHKICVRIALSELRRKRWQDRSLDELLDQGAPIQGKQNDTNNDTDMKSAGPEAVASGSMIMVWLKTAMMEELSPRQMEALKLVAMKDLPIEEAARRLDTNRNALYKLIHDARVKLKARMARDGLGIGDLDHG